MTLELQLGLVSTFVFAIFMELDVEHSELFFKFEDPVNV
jgi:hypothetical protein